MHLLQALDGYDHGRGGIFKLVAIYAVLSFIGGFFILAVCAPVSAAMDAYKAHKKRKAQR